MNYSMPSILFFPKHSRLFIPVSNFLFPSSHKVKIKEREATEGRGGIPIRRKKEKTDLTLLKAGRIKAEGNLFHRGNI